MTASPIQMLHKGGQAPGTGVLLESCLWELAGAKMMAPLISGTGGQEGSLSTFTVSSQGILFHICVPLYVRPLPAWTASLSVRVTAV